MRDVNASWETLSDLCRPEMGSPCFHACTRTAGSSTDYTPAVFDGRLYDLGGCRYRGGRAPQALKRLPQG